MKNAKKKDALIRSSAAEYLTYVAATGENGVELRYEDENIWLTQKMLSIIYGVNIATINEHIKNIYKDNELDENSTIRKFLIVQKEGNREVNDNDNYELDEPRSDDIKEIATAKVKQAYEIVKRPCISLDADFRIDELNGFPRAFVNFSLDTVGIQGILKLMENKNNRTCAFNECLAYHDGKEIHYFYGNHPGNLSNKIQGQDRKEKWSDLWYIFMPKGFNKTLAEMSEQERNNRKVIDGSYSAMEKFAEWYKMQN